MEDGKTTPRQKFQKSYTHENQAHAYAKIAKCIPPGYPIGTYHHQKDKNARTENETNQQQPDIVVKLSGTKIG